jgi:hypothetical protein
MCIVCKEWTAGRMTSKEALRNLGELMQSASLAGKAHYDDVVEKILDKEVPLSDNDEELDQSWHEETHDG